MLATARGREGDALAQVRLLASKLARLGEGWRNRSSNACRRATSKSARRWSRPVAKRSEVAKARTSGEKSESPAAR